MKRGLLALAAACLLPLVSSTPAEAASSGTVSVPSFTLFDDCTYHPYSYTLQPEPGYTDDVDLEVRIYGPDGIEAYTDSVYSPRSSGTEEFFLCLDVLPGVYQVRATMEACDEYYNCYKYALPATSFTVSMPLTKTTLAASPKRPKKGGVVAFTITSKDERPAGYFSNDYARVWLEKKQGERWVRVQRSKTTTESNGKARLQYRWNTGGRELVRAVTASSEDYIGSTSQAIRVG